MLLNLIKKSYKQVIENASIVFFLVMFLILSSILFPYIVIVKTSVVAIILILCLLSLTTAFISGWFQVIKETAGIDIEKIKEKKYFSIFIEGIGKNIVSISIGCIIYFITLVLIIFTVRILATKFFGSLDFIIQDATKFTQDANSLVEYLKNLPTDKMFIIYSWQICYMVALSVFNFLFMFYFPAIIFDDKSNIFLNPFKSIWTSIKFTFANFLGSLAIYVPVCILYLTFNILEKLFKSNTILSILILFIYIYFIAIVIMLIFNYYETKNNCSDRTDSIGENEIINSASKEN